ncbi:MAG: ABC transporter permease [Pseudomonadota bacterium]
MSSGVHILLAETGAELRKTLRAPEFVIPTLALPSCFYLLFGVMLSRGNAAESLLATYGVFAVMGPAIFGFGAGVANERERGWLDIKRVSPAPAWSYIGAKLLATLIFGLLALLPIYIAAATLGEVALPRGAWLGLLSTHLLAVIPFSLLGLALGFRFGANAAIAMSNLCFLSLAVLGGLWFPIALFPSALQSLAVGLPSFHLAEVALSFTRTAAEAGIGQHLAMIGVMSAILATLAGLAWQRQRH